MRRLVLTRYHFKKFDVILMTCYYIMFFFILNFNDVFN